MRLNSSGLNDMAATLVIGLLHLTNSEMYLGMKYMEIYDSGLLTRSEKEKLRKNNSILNDRELEKSFKGKISGKPKVEF